MATEQEMMALITEKDIRDLLFIDFKTPVYKKDEFCDPVLFFEYEHTPSSGFGIEMSYDKLDNFITVRFIEQWVGAEPGWMIQVFKIFDKINKRIQSNE